MFEMPDKAVDSNEPVKAQDLIEMLKRPIENNDYIDRFRKHGILGPPPFQIPGDRGKDGEQIKPEKALELATDAMLETLHYMKYREYLRRCTGEFRNVSYASCILHITSVSCIVLATSLLSQRFNPADSKGLWDKGACESSRLNFDDPNDLAILAFSLLIFFSSINLYFCVNPGVYAKIITLSKIASVLYFSFCPAVMFYNHKCNVARGIASDPAYSRSILNLRAYTFVGPLFYDILVLSIYLGLVLLVNLFALIREFIYPGLLMLLLWGELKFFEVFSVEKVRFSVPADQMKDGKPFHTKMVGCCVKIAKGGMPRALLRYLTSITSKRRRKVKPSVLRRLPNYQYIGQLNSEFKPHGFGYWQGFTHNSELLVGYWENGLPLGSFKSRESGTGSGFTNVLIGWIESVDIRNRGLEMGVAGAECCVSGSFFRTFPRIMSYRTEKFEDISCFGDLIKYLGNSTPPHEQYSHEGRVEEYITRSGVIMRLLKVSNDIVNYRYPKFLGILRGSSVSNSTQNSEKSASSKVRKMRLSNSTISREKLMNKMECVLSALSVHTPSFSYLDFSEIRISIDHSMRLHVNGYVPSKNNSESSDSSGRESSMTPNKDLDEIRVKIVKIHVENSQEQPEGEVVNLPYCGLGPRIKHALLAEGWERRGITGSLEACMFIHGFNVSCDEAVKILGQVVSFGNYPQYIKPLVFSWPSGNRLTHYKIAKENSMSEDLRARFVLVLQTLSKNGIRDIHVITHSMGATMFLDAFTEIVKSSDTANLFVPLQNPKYTYGNGERLRLLTVTLFNPEYGLEDFKDCAYPLLRTYCDHITIYGDTNDKVLWITEILTNRRCLGRWVNNICIEPPPCDDMGSKNQDSDLDCNISQRDVRITMGSIIMPFLLLDVEANTSRNQWLDVDVIDTTWLGSNVHSHRHSYWFINREIAEDLRELIVCRKRAKHRMSRLDRSIGNVWVYRVAPIDLKTIYDHRF